MARRAPVVTLVAGLMLLLSACGGRSGDQGRPAQGAPPAQNPPSTAPKAQPGAVDPNAPEANTPGDIPDDQVFVGYQPPGARFSVKVPEGWARMSSGGAVVFTDKLNSIKLETRPSPSQPTAASATSAELPGIRSASSNFQGGDVTEVRRRGGTAVLIRYRADAPADQVTGKVVRDDVERYEFWRGGSAAILTLAGPVGADNVDPWRIVTDSFRWR